MMFNHRFLQYVFLTFVGGVLKKKVFQNSVVKKSVKITRLFGLYRILVAFLYSSILYQKKRHVNAVPTLCLDLKNSLRLPSYDR